MNLFVTSLLDLIGDLYLLGAPILGEIKAVKPGHTVHSIITKQGLENFDEYFDTLLKIFEKEFRNRLFVDY